MNPFEPARLPEKVQSVLPYAIWGIVNITPDSFHDRGRYFAPEAALAHARALHQDGAAVLDLGAASSRPGAEDVPAAEEMARLLPVLRMLCAEFRNEPSPLLSVDTWRAEVAASALEAGAHIINDISACAWEPALRDVLAQYRPGYVLMHCQGRPASMQNAPRYTNILDEVESFFLREMTALVKGGLPENRITLDPGIGFGKTPQHNLALVHNADRFLRLGRPLLFGVSQKKFLDTMPDSDKPDRDRATQVCTAVLAEHGVIHHRVHDVAATLQTLLRVCARQALYTEAQSGACSA